jgi:hypothetical protein
VYQSKGLRIATLLDTKVGGCEAWRIEAWQQLTLSGQRPGHSSLTCTLLYLFLCPLQGPEVRTALVKGGVNIELAAGQEVTLVAVGDEYDQWEGYKDPATGGCMVRCCL